MELFAPGIPGKVKDVSDGGCLLLGTFATPFICFMVRLDNNNRFILNPSHSARDGFSFPALYAVDQYLGNQECISFQNARLRPSMKLDHIGKGYFKQGGLSRAMFLAPDACIIQATLDQIQYTGFDLLTGAHWDQNISNLYHATSWSVEVPDGDGRHVELVRFDA